MVKVEPIIQSEVSQKDKDQYTVSVFFFLTYFTLYNRPQFHTLH